MSSNDVVIFKGRLTAFGLTQHVTTSAHATGNIVDLIFTEEAASIKLTSYQVRLFLLDHNVVSAVRNIKKPPIEKKTLLVCKLKCITEAASIKLTSCQVGLFLLDHNVVSAVLNIKKPPIEKKTSVCKLKCITEETFKAAFNNEAIDLTSPIDTVLHQLNNELHKALATIAPLREIQFAVHQRQPWSDEVVKARHKVVWNREQIWHKYPEAHTCKAYQVERNIYNRLLNYKKK